MWARILNVMLGIWLIAAPSVLSYAGPARVNHLIVGPLVASVALIAMWEATRPLRWANLAFGLWLIVAPVIVGGALAATINSLVVGLAVGMLALFGGKVTQRFGGGWSVLWRDQADETQEEKI